MAYRVPVANGHIWYRRLFQMSASVMKTQRELGGGRNGTNRRLPRRNVIWMQEPYSSEGYYDDLLSEETLRKLGRGKDGGK